MANMAVTQMSRSAVKQTIRGTGTIPGGTTPLDITIPAVTTARCAVRVTGYSQQTTYGGGSMPNGALINSTTLRITKAPPPGNDYNVIFKFSYQVMEFN